MCGIDFGIRGYGECDYRRRWSDIVLYECWLPTSQQIQLQMRFSVDLTSAYVKQFAITIRSRTKRTAQKASRKISGTNVWILSSIMKYRLRISKHSFWLMFDLMVCIQPIICRKGTIPAGFTLTTWTRTCGIDLNRVHPRIIYTNHLEHPTRPRCVTPKQPWTERITTKLVQVRGTQGHRSICSYLTPWRRRLARIYSRKERR